MLARITREKVTQIDPIQKTGTSGISTMSHKSTSPSCKNIRSHSKFDPPETPPIKKKASRLILDYKVRLKAIFSLKKEI